MELAKSTGAIELNIQPSGNIYSQLYCWIQVFLPFSQEKEIAVYARFTSRALFWLSSGLWRLPIRYCFAISNGFYHTPRDIYLLVLQIAKIPDDDSQKLVYLDGLMYSVTNFYPLAVKNPKEYRMLWNHALYGGPKPEQKQPVDASQDGDSAAPSIDVAPELSPTAFAAIFETLMSHQSLSRRLKVWSVILMSSLGPYRRMRPLTQDERPPLEKCLTLSFYRRINETLFRSGT